MKLIKCYVSSFGKLKDFTLEFNSGLNVINQDNGWGKSTLSMFIKAMFYGLKGSNKHSIEDNERKKYKPWNSTEKFGGYIEFEKDGGVYRIERFFGNKENEDELKVFDTVTGKAFANTEGIGERIFGIDEDGFFSTTYFSERDFEITGNSSLTAKYNSVCGVQNSDAFDRAVAKIENKMKTYKIRGGKGLIEDTRNEVKSVMEDLERASRSNETAKALKEQISLLEEEITILQKDINAISEKISLAGKSEAIAVKKGVYREAIKEYESVKNRLNDLERTFNGYYPDQNQIKLYSNCYKESIQMHQNIERLKMEIEVQSSIVREKPNKKSLPLLPIVLFALAVVFIGINLIINSDNTILTVILYVLSGLLAIFGVVTLILDNKKVKKEVLPDNKQLIDAKKSELFGFEQILSEYNKKINEFLLKFNLSSSDTYNCLLELMENVAQRERLLSDLNTIKQRVDNLAKDEDVTLETERVEFSAKELGDELKLKQQSLNYKSREIADKKASYSRLEEIIASIPDLENRKSQLIEQGVQYTEEYSILSKTLDFLKTADENLKIRYREPLENSFNKYISIISDGKIRNAKIDIDFNVTVEESGVTKEHGFYSKGSQNLFDVCKRFALIDVLFTKEAPFMIMDDPFVNFDEKKIVQATDLIRKLAESYQIIYFTCHESRKA